jgi:hypothetical protein
MYPENSYIEELPVAEEEEDLYPFIQIAKGNDSAGNEMVTVAKYGDL